KKACSLFHLFFEQCAPAAMSAQEAYRLESRGTEETISWAIDVCRTDYYGRYAHLSWPHSASGGTSSTNDSGGTPGLHGHSRRNLTPMMT
ncbi:MAG: hypothetical protein ACPIOQ_46945, partial [Promethearchaeia archaeon]